MTTKKKTAPAKAPEKTGGQQLLEIEAAAQALAFQCRAANAHNSVLQHMGKYATAVERLASALRKYKRFDIEALSLTTPVLVKHPKFEMPRDIRLPRFAMVPLFPNGTLHGTKATLRLGRFSSSYPFSLGLSAINARLDGAMEAFGPEGWDTHDDIELVATAPTIPATIREEVEKVAQDFNELHLVYEAEWKVHQVAPDPLVIGTVAGHNFLVAQFDLTKMESYIAREFTE